MKNKLIELFKENMVFESDHTSLAAHVGHEPNTGVDILREQLAEAVIKIIKQP